MNVYGILVLGLVCGEGCVVEDENGKEYFDFLFGIVVNSLGYQYLVIIEVVMQQFYMFGYILNFFVYQLEVQFVECFVEVFKSDQFICVFFCNLGVEVNEIVFKLLRFIGCWCIFIYLDGFYGCIMGFFVFIGQEKKCVLFEFMLLGVEYFFFNDFDVL